MKVYVVMADRCCECEDRACVCGSDDIHEIFMNKKDAEREAQFVYRGRVLEYEVVEGPGLMTRGNERRCGG